MTMKNLAGIAVGVWLLSWRNRGTIGAIVPDKCVGVTQCADGTWSTLPADRRGVCTHHGGAAEGYRRRVVKEETGEAVDVIEVIDDQGQPVDVVEVRLLGRYSYTTYTTNKGKTRPAIAIRFDRKPQAEVLETLRNSRFWWNRNTGMWYGWETPENMELVESLPVAVEGERVPVVAEKTELVPVEEESPSPALPVAFRIDPPARGRLYSNAEYADLISLLSAQRMIGQRPERAFPEMRQLWQEIVEFDQWGLKNFPKWAGIFSDQPGYYWGRKDYVPHITNRNHDHPAGLLKHYIQVAYDRFRNAYNLSEEGFDKYRNRNYEDVQAFFTDQLSEAVAEVRKRIELLKNPFWFRPDVAPQEKIDAGASAEISINLMGRILYIIHDINPEEHWIRNEKFNGGKYWKYDLLSGKIRLNDYLAAIERKKAEYEASNDKMALRLKKHIGELYQFNREYLEKGYAFHLPTYSRKIREAGVGILGEKKYYSSGRSSESYIEIHPANREGGIRVMLSIVPSMEVESILVSTAVIHECFRGKMTYQDIYFKCYSGSRTYPDMKKYLDGEEPIELLYGLDPRISGPYSPTPFYHNGASFYI